MKKKIGDVTLRELATTCRKTDACWDCPLREVCPSRYVTIDSMLDDINSEVEVEL